MKTKIDPRVRAKLEEIGVDAVKSKLVWIMNVRTLAQQDEREEDLAGCGKSRPIGPDIGL
jgi:hypothetical protein